MGMVKAEIDRLKREANSSFTSSKSKANYCNKIIKIVDAVSQVPLLERVEIFSNVKVRQALADHRNTGSKGYARSFPNIAEKLGDKAQPEKTSEFKNRIQATQDRQNDSPPPSSTPSK